VGIFNKLPGAGAGTTHPGAGGGTMSGDGTYSDQWITQGASLGNGVLSGLPSGINRGNASAPPPKGNNGAGAGIQIGASGSSGGRYSYAQLVTIARNAGMPNPQLMAAISMAESSGLTNASHRNSNGSVDSGLWQINSIHGYDQNRLKTDPMYNAKAAADILRKQGLKAWSVYNSGAYRQYYKPGEQGAGVGALVGSPGAKAGGGGNGHVWPTDVHTITSGFAVNRGDHAHGGIDIGAPMNAPIYAATSGRVIAAGPASGFGNWIKIQAPDGTVTIYGHMYNQGVLVKVGQQVNAGQTIGKVGSNGHSTGPHLHFEVHPGGGGGVDPAKWLNGAGPGGHPSGGANPWGDQDSIAAAFGLSSALFDSDPELRKVLDQTLAEQLDPTSAAGRARFQSLLQNTNWYKTHSAKQREFLSLEATDPAEAKARFISALSDVMATAQQMGVQMSTNEQWVLARSVAMFGVDGNQLRFAIAHQFKSNKDANYSGDIGNTILQLRQLSADYGYPVPNAQLNVAAKDILDGKETLETYKNALRNYAKGMFPALAPAIDAGRTVRDAAQPYITTYANTLERNPDEIDLSKDPTIRRALNQVGPDVRGFTRQDGNDNTNVQRSTPQGNTNVKGASQTKTAGEPSLMPLWQFENQLKQDPRWLQTDAAHNALTSAGAQILKDMGVAA
jgi:murein DD-endopeptidase MepM/ murein hydrolase activator NlpD